MAIVAQSELNNIYLSDRKVGQGREMRTNEKKMRHEGLLCSGTKIPDII